MTESVVGHLGYLGIVLVLVLGGLGLPVPEEAPVILAAILSHKGRMFWPVALAACFSGVLLGDFVVYALGFIYGEKVLSFRLTRKFLTRAREAQIKGYFHRHGIKILILGRFAVGFRTAAYLTAGILRLPPLRLLLADLFAASLSTLLMFGLGYFFADWIEAGLKEAKHYVVLLTGVALGFWLLYRYYRARQRAGLPVGPPVPVSDDVPLPPDDLHPPPTRKSPTVRAERRTGEKPAAPPAPSPAPMVESEAEANEPIESKAQSSRPEPIAPPRRS